jgi:hypothetical protein
MRDSAFLDLQHRRLAGLDHMLGTAHRGRRIVRRHLAGATALDMIGFPSVKMRDLDLCGTATVIR